MAMTQESFTSSSGASVPRPDYSLLDFNSPATIGIVLYENQVTRGILRGEIANSEKGIRADMIAMERSLREEIGRSTKNLILLMVSLHGVSLSVVAALITLG